MHEFRPGFDDQPHLPKYLRLAQWLERQISNGVFAPESPLPTEEQLCREFGLSRGTVQQAMNGLIQKGLVRREQGRGTFVNPPRRPDISSFTMLSFNQLMQRQGRIPTTLVRRAEVLPAPAALAQRLQIEPATPVFQIERLRFADGQPVSLEERFIPQALCPDLLSQDLARDSIHQLLVHTYHIPMVRMEHMVEMSNAAAEVATALHVLPGSPLFLVERLTYTNLTGTITPAVWFRAFYHELSVSFDAAFATR